MAEKLYSLETAAFELKKVYPMLEFKEIDHSLVLEVFGQFKIMVTAEDDQFVTDLVVDEYDQPAEDYQFNPQPISTFVCDSAPMGVNQVIHKFERYFRGLRTNLERIDRVTRKRKQKVSEPPIVTKEQRQRIADLEREGFVFEGSTYEEAQAFIEEVG